MTTKMLSAAALCAVLAACSTGGGDGGSDGTDTPPIQGASPEGVYFGPVTGGDATSADLFVLEDGTFYAVAFDADDYVVGFEQGSGTASSNHYQSSNAKEFLADPPVAGSLSASFVAKTSFHGTITGNGATLTLDAQAVPATVFDYDKPALLADVTGNWRLVLSDGETADVTLSTTGTLAGVSSGGCQFTGTVKPRASGKNIFDVTTQSGPAPCAHPGQKAAGIAMSSVDDGSRSLAVMQVAEDRSAGLVSVGWR